MSYSPDAPTAIELRFTGGRYHVPSDALALELEFQDGASHPPLPWSEPSLFSEYRAPLQAASQAHAQCVAPLAKATTADHLNDAAWNAATRGDGVFSARHQDAGHQDAAKASSFNNATPLQVDQVSPWKHAGQRDGSAAHRWNEGTVSDRTNLVSPWISKTPARDARPALPFFSVDLSGTAYDDSEAANRLLNTDSALSIVLDAPDATVRAKGYRVAFEFGFRAPERPIVPNDVTRFVTARQASPRDGTRRVPWGLGQSAWHDWNLPYPVEPNIEPPPDPVEEPPRRAVYRIMNTLQIYDVETNTPLAVQNVTISLDIDSLSWKFTGSLFGQGSLALIQPDASGMKDISVTINGHEWIFAIEKYTSDEKFPKTIFSIEGVSRTQYMAGDYAPARSYTNSIATTAAQAASAELTDTGFSLTWPTGDDDDLPDWSIPESALSYRDKAPAQVIAQIVTAAGGVMIPHMASDGWTIQPRYKVAPWAWASATPDAIVYIGMVIARSAQYEPAPAFDSCFVSGINQGVSVDVQRTGSGGLNPMPDIFDDLITHAQAAIARGRAELSAAGNKVVETLRIPVPEQEGAPGILIPGMLVKVTHDDAGMDYMALVLANSISIQKAGGAEVYQSVTLERSA